MSECYGAFVKRTECQRRAAHEDRAVRRDDEKRLRLFSRGRPRCCAYRVRWCALCHVRFTILAQGEIGNRDAWALEQNGPVVRFVPAGRKFLAEARRSLSEDGKLASEISAPVR